MATADEQDAAAWIARNKARREAAAKRDEQRDLRLIRRQAKIDARNKKKK